MDIEAKKLNLKIVQVIQQLTVMPEMYPIS